MNPAEFNEYWPQGEEGQKSANLTLVAEARKEQKKLAAFPWVSWTCLLGLAAAKACGVSFETLAIIATFIAFMHLRGQFVANRIALLELKVDLEYIKGGLRDNRWGIHHHGDKLQESLAVIDEKISDRGF